MIQYAPAIAKGLIALAAIITLASLWQSARAFLPAWRATRAKLAEAEERLK